MNEVKLKSIVPRLGKALRDYREAAGKNLSDVATAADISTSMLSQIERGIVSPSIETLALVCQALEIEIAELFERLAFQDAVRVHKQSERLQVIRDGIHYEQLMTSGHGGIPIELFLLEVEPGHETPLTDSGHEGIEMGYVLKGEGILTVEKIPYKVSEGDSIFFNARLPHQVKNNGSVMFRAVWSTSPPHFKYVDNN